ncbi:two-component sensor histidine kinase [Phyllobacterium phragmitis]|uniref:histidine kinase n=1 Tax=Phyllobacterium phragmitis TaxID=2670329 RepID=A0A2S9IQR0_9HYPH|nr:sensor histidine kinase KdpD [Phyllobacterium phragmitis]PRD42842.1 two-component sensor histidine kinase [Phyllobacterium phragmitis]
MANDRRDPDRRPSPEALLKAAQREETRAGKLKIFVGSAPGVGKTYEMLRTAHARAKDGYDIVAGVVETHGRNETAALLEGLEIVPHKHITYRGRRLEEMDIDAIIERRPQIVLVDELAHTNASGSRHPKRYMDVEELLDNGIDVYTTVNIQHIESLNDVVAQITRVRVRETVPDAIFDRADAVELIDLTPEDLIARLRDGKVYVAKQATRALKHFFSPANLTALRELALRRTAEQVDEQLLTQMQAGAIEGPWAAGERILVCVSEDPRSAGLVRYAKRLADRLHAPWTALYIECRRGSELSEEQRDRIADTLRLAQGMKGEAVTIPGSERRVADDAIGYAQANNITHIVIGKSSRSRWFEILNGSVVHELVRRAGNISVHVIAGEQIAGGAIAKKTVKTAQPAPAFNYRPYGVSVLAVAASVGFGLALWPWIRIENIDLVFLAAIVGVAVRFGLWPSLFTSVLSTLCYNFFFTDPYYTLLVSRPTDVIAVIFFGIVAIVVSHVAARARIQAVAAMGRARTTESLYTFSRKLAGVGTLDDVLWVAAYQTALMLKVQVVLLLPEQDGAITVKSGYPPEDMLDDSDLAAANWAWKNDRPAGRGADTLPGARRLFLPMRTGRGVVGIVGIDSDKPGPLLTPDQRRLLDALIDQAALAIERVHLVEDMDRAQRTIETDRLRSALLTSISHDLKTPLAAIMGAAGTLKEFAPALDDQAKAELLGTVIDESERLNRFIANLLDMTRIESGAISTEPQLGLHYVGDIVGSALKRARKMTVGHEIDIDIPSDLPMLRLDPVLFEQVLFNLLDNAAKYAPAESAIVIRGRENEDFVVLQIMDEGPGIPPQDLERVFDTFYRVAKSDQVRAGTGLGLSICRGFIEAMGGTISAGNRTDRSGAVFTITMPVPSEEPFLDNPT